MDIDKLKEKFPVEIDLGKKREEYGSPVEVSKSEKKTYYPSLYMSDIKGISDIPKEGYALIRFKRGRRNFSDGGEDDDASASVDLQIHSICLPEEDRDSGDLMQSMARAIKDAGLELDVDVEDDEEGD